VGDVKLGDGKPGTLRKLNRVEVGSLFAGVGM
jgi:23S rRNA pseudouridine2605 synthase